MSTMVTGTRPAAQAASAPSEMAISSGWGAKRISLPGIGTAIGVVGKCPPMLLSMVLADAAVAVAPRRESGQLNQVGSTYSSGSSSRRTGVRTGNPVGPVRLIGPASGPIEPPPQPRLRLQVLRRTAPAAPPLWRAHSGGGQTRSPRRAAGRVQRD